MTSKISLVFAGLFLLALANGYFFTWLSEAFFHCEPHDNGLGEFSTSTQLYLIVIAAPLVETYLLQHLPQQVFNVVGLKNVALRILIPSLMFAAFHPYCLVYAVMALVGGIILNVLYVYSRTHSLYYFFIVLAFHALYNLYGFLFVE